jgi:hypothetical protein
MQSHTDVKKLGQAALAAALVAAAIVAGCGGGGGGAYGGPGPGGGGNPSPTPPPSPSPTPMLQGTLNAFTGGTYAGGYNGSAAASDDVVFSCGCTGQAGTGTTDAGGDFSLSTTSTPTPAAPDPTYTIVPTRNYIVVAEPASGKGPQAWQLEFAGKTTGATLALGGSGAQPAASSVNDVYSEAGALYVFLNSTKGSTAFDDWNFNTVEAWVQHLKTSANASEKTFLNDIAAAGGTNSSLFPAAPGWNGSQPVNGKIDGDITTVAGSGDAMLPTPCPGGTGTCTGTPAP